MRLFIAIELPDALKDRLERMKAEIPGATWAKRDTYHLTLRFLGDDVPEGRLFELKAALSDIQLPDFEVALQGVGRFPPKATTPARVLWVGIAPNPALMRLYQAVEKQVTGIGFPPDDHPFSGHVTLARLKHFKPEPSVAEFLTTHANFRVAPFPAEHFHLFSSTLTPQGARYTEMARFPLYIPDED